VLAGVFGYFLTIGGSRHECFAYEKKVMTDEMRPKTEEFPGSVDVSARFDTLEIAGIAICVIEINLNAVAAFLLSCTEIKYHNKCSKSFRRNMGGIFDIMVFVLWLAWAFLAVVYVFSYSGLACNGYYIPSPERPH